MLVKFFKTKNGGSVADINYLLQLTNLRKKYENHSLSQEQCQELLQNLKKSLESMHQAAYKKDVKIDVDSAKKRDIGGMGFDF